MGSGQKRKGEVEKAIADFKHALKLDPSLDLQPEADLLLLSFDSREGMTSKQVSLGCGWPESARCG